MLEIRICKFTEHTYYDDGCYTGTPDQCKQTTRIKLKTESTVHLKKILIQRKPKFNSSNNWYITAAGIVDMKQDKRESAGDEPQVERDFKSTKKTKSYLPRHWM